MVRRVGGIQQAYQGRTDRQCFCFTAGKGSVTEEDALTSTLQTTPFVVTP